MNARLPDLTADLRRLTPWAILACVVAVASAPLRNGSIPSDAWSVVMIAGAVAAGLTSRFINKNPALYGIVMLAAASQLVVSDAHRDLNAQGGLADIDIVGDLAIAIALAAMLAYSAVRRIGRPTFRDLVEVVVVLLGASIATWVLLTEPLIDQGVSVPRAVFTSAFLPLNVIIGTFMIDLWNNGLRRNRGIQLASLAAVAYVVGSIIARLQLVGVGANGGAEHAMMLYSVACGLMFAAIAHTTFQPHLVVPDRTNDTTMPESRLITMGASVLVAVTLMAINAPSGAYDTLFRAIATMALIALVVVRLALAMHEHHLARASLQQRIDCDDLTGLPTRPRFVALVHDALESNWRSARHPVVIHLNIDRFKNINDSFGHHGANEVLIQIAGRLQAVASSFGGQAARLGGDDFAIIDATTTNAEDAMQRVDQIRAAIATPVNVAETTVFVTTSIGVAIAPSKRSLSAEELIRHADIANHRAKLDGANRVSLFDDSMQANVANRMEVEHALHGAIGRHEMLLYHQPIVDITSGRVTGFEALIRWQRSDGTVVSPAAFIPIAEDTGIICELGAWALHEALRMLREWIDEGVVEPTTTISVNVSPRQIADPQFARIVRDALDQTNMPAHLLWLEMTESMMLEEPDLARSTLREIRATGVRLALDDFGTGFSSLSLLQQFPIQRIKIDRAFVQGIADNTNDRSLVRTIIAMAHSMGLDLVAEGVETVHQLQSLRELGCIKAQGYLISHPVPADAMRSTMSALAELASLSLFQPQADPIGAARLDPIYDQAPLPVGVMTSAGPIGMLARRPLGQPVP